MTTLVAHLDDIQHRLDALARRHHVPGAVLAVSHGDEEALVSFLEFRQGRPGYLFAGRVARRTGNE
jgi:hypothetical protein